MNSSDWVKECLRDFPGGPVGKNLPASAGYTGLTSGLRSSQLPGSSDGKAPACNEGDLGSIPGSGRSPGEGKWQPTPVLLPGKCYGRWSLVGYSPWVTKSLTWLNNFIFTFTGKLPNASGQLSPRDATTEARLPENCAPQEEKPPQWEAGALKLECSLHFPQLEKARTQQRRPRGAKNK